MGILSCEKGRYSLIFGDVIVLKYVSRVLYIMNLKKNVLKPIHWLLVVDVRRVRTTRSRCRFSLISPDFLRKDNFAWWGWLYWGIRNKYLWNKAFKVMFTRVIIPFSYFLHWFWFYSKLSTFFKLNSSKGRRPGLFCGFTPFETA